MNICGVLVHARPDAAGEVAAALALLPGVELHAHPNAGRLIVTVEDTEQASAMDGLARIHALPGVVSAALVYHHFEPDSDPGAVAKEA
jgi:periplasmic nitrate reductase NapD